MVRTWTEARCTGQKKLIMELSNRRKRGRPQIRFLDVVKEDMPGVCDKGGC